MKRYIRWWQVIGLFILLTGVVLAVWSAQQQDQSMRNELLIKTSIAKTGISTGYFEALNGSASDISLPEYQALKTQLGKIRGADPDIRFAYLMGQRQDGSIFFYADSEPAESDNYSPPGEAYNEASTVLSNQFANGEKVTEGPLSDRWGTWVSGFIPITDPDTGRVIAVLGMDVDAKDWNTNLAEASAAIIAATLLILVIIIAFGLIQQRSLRENKRLETSEEKFSKVFHANPALIAVSTIDNGRIIDVNESFLSALGYSRDEVIGRTTSDLGLYFEPAQRNFILDEVKRTGHVRNTDVKLYRKNRDLLYGSLSSITIEVSGVFHLFTVILDLTERKRAGEALRESEEMFRGIFDSVNDGIHIHEIEPDGKPGKFIAVNEVACRMLQYTHDELMEHSPLDFVTGFHSRPFDEIIRDLSTTGHSVFETEHQGKDGTIIPVEINSHVVSLKGKRVVVAVVRNITERRQAERELKESEERYRFLVENSHDIIYTLSPLGNFTFVSPAWTTLLGHPVSEVIGHPFQPLVHPEDLPGCMAWLQKVIESGKRQEGIEYRVRHIDGSWYWHTSSAVPLRDKSGTIIGFEGTARDITERRQADEALYQLTDRLSLATRAGGVGIWDYDVVNNTLTWDDQMFALYGITQEQFCGAYEAWQAGLHPDDRQQGDAEIQMALGGKKEFNTEFRVLWPDGTIHTLRALAIVQRDASGKPLRMIGTNWDITAQKVAEEVLRKANKKLNLLSSITRHDITNQLTVLVGYLRILEKKQPDASFSEHFNKINTSAQRISVMLRFTKEYEQIGVNAPKWQDCRILIDTAAKDAPLGKVKVKNEQPAGTEVYADPLVVKVFYNLMDNAARYGGKITTIRFSVQESGDNHLIVCEDDGDGVPAPEKEKIFERGFGKNTGLGLALSREILDITGITIRETGELGKGARFEMTVPKGAWRLTCEDMKRE